MNSSVCEFCSKSFITKTRLIRHQTQTKSCLALQGKQNIVECPNCQKKLTADYFKSHKLKCDRDHEEEKKTKLFDIVQEKNSTLEQQNKKLKTELMDVKKSNDLLKIDLTTIKIECEKYKQSYQDMRKEHEKLEIANTILKEQNEKLYTTSNNITMKLVEKTGTVNNTNNTNNNTTNTIIVNTPLTNDVLRQCASTFSIANAYNIGGITKHFTNSLEKHITCTDPSRNIFKYTNEKDEEITDQNLEILLPQYLTAVKDRNNFLYKEVMEYFEKNQTDINVKMDYNVLYNALNNIIEKTGQQNKYTEKCKQKIIRECKRRFLEKNKNKEITLTKALSIEDVMLNVIETGGSVHDFVDRYFRYDDEEETDEQFTYRREMEDIFRAKKREWLKSHNTAK
jgi:hypothetical protein